MTEPKQAPPKASFIGNGAIGSLLAASCQRANLLFEMWWRKHSSKTLTVQFMDGHTEILSSNLPDSTELLVVATKAWQVKEAINQYKHFLSPEACVVLLHNGAGTEEWTLDTLPSQSVLRMTTSRAALKKNHDLVIETGQGLTQAGWLREPPREEKIRIENWTNYLLPECEWFDDIQQPIWQKLAVNSVINPLTALNNIKNGGLNEPQYKHQIEGLIDEFLLVCDTLKIAMNKQQIRQLVWSVINKTAHNYSSMHQDIANHRPTEIDYINGFLLSQGCAVGLELPHNKEMVTLINAIE